MSEETKYELVKFIDDELELEVSVSPKEETIWMTQEGIALLFGKSKSTINEHIKNILNYEFDRDEVVRKFGKTELSTIKTKPVYFYNLDLILAIGYRVNSKRGIIFRKWATKVLRDYLIKGYVINEERSLVTNKNYVRLINTVESLNKRLRQ